MASSEQQNVKKQKCLLRFVIFYICSLNENQKNEKKHLFCEASGRGFLIKIYGFLKESCPQSPLWRRSGRGLLIKIHDFLKESCAQSPLWSRSGRGFLIKIHDFLKESCPRALPERIILSGRAPWKGTPY